MWLFSGKNFDGSHLCISHVCDTLLYEHPKYNGACNPESSATAATIMNGVATKLFRYI